MDGNSKQYWQLGTVAAGRAAFFLFPRGAQVRFLFLGLRLSFDGLREN